jgi:hypothetical protein
MDKPLQCLESGPRMVIKLQTKDKKMNMDPLMFWKMVLYGVPAILGGASLLLIWWANVNIYNIEKNMKSSQDIEQLANAVVNWGDYSGGSRASYENLVSEKNEFNNPLVTEKLRNIESIYSSATMVLMVERLNTIWIPGSTPENAKCEPIEGYDARNIRDHLSANFWTERARAACLLQRLKTAKNKKDIFNEKLFDKLIYLMGERNESSLVVSKMALSAYSSLTGFVPSEVFDFAGAVKDWDNPIRKAEILKIEL